MPAAAPPAPDNMATQTQTYCYDGAGRLLVRTGTGSTTVTYAYDKNGNRTSDKWGTDPTSSYTFNAGNQLTSGGLRRLEVSGQWI